MPSNADGSRMGISSLDPSSELLMLTSEQQSTVVKTGSAESESDCIHHLLMYLSFADGHLDCSDLLAIVNNAAQFLFGCSPKLHFTNTLHHPNKMSSCRLISRITHYVL